MSEELVQYQVTDKLALIRINRPDKRNAMSYATLDALQAAVARAAADPAVVAIALTGAGDKAFCAGFDLNELLERDLPTTLEPIVQGLAAQLERTPKPTIAAINGLCFGGGLEVALACDFRVAAPNAKFAAPEGKVGIIPGGGATARLPRLVGTGWALEMMMLGATLDAEQALRIGLITRLVAAEELLPEVQRMTDLLASYPPLVPRTIKAVVQGGMDASLAGALILEKFAQGALVQTEDKREGVSSFLEKREPHFKGR